MQPERAGVDDSVGMRFQTEMPGSHDLASAVAKRQATQLPVERSCQHERSGGCEARTNVSRCRDPPHRAWWAQPARCGGKRDLASGIHIYGYMDPYRLWEPACAMEQEAFVPFRCLQDECAVRFQAEREERSFR